MRGHFALQISFNYLIKLLDTVQSPPEYYCWGIGLGRTGTNSLCSALKILGYKRVIHNPFWWQLPFLHGGADEGIILYYKYLDYKFPNSKFVLTMRDLESWLSSMEYAFQSYPKVTRNMDEGVKRRMLLYEANTFDKTRMIEAYHRHYEGVERYFKDKDHKLIRMNIIEGDGWDVLCPGLNRDIPTQAFPYKNKRNALL